MKTELVLRRTVNSQLVHGKPFHGTADLPQVRHKIDHHTEEVGRERALKPFLNQNPLKGLTIPNNYLM